MQPISFFRHQLATANLRRCTNPAWALMDGYDKLQANASANAQHFDRVCSIGLEKAGIYTAAFERWKRLWSPTKDGVERAQMRTMRLQHRAMIGMSNPSLWESNITLNPVFGTPELAGSACKGLARRFAISSLGVGKEHFDGIFESTDLTSKVDFLDAWWCPGSSPGATAAANQRPLVREQSTPHHPRFLSSKGGEPASPFDAPVPVPQIATHGSFLFVAKGPQLWATYALDILQLALEFEGIGARTPEYGTVLAVQQAAPSGISKANQ